MAVTRVRAIVRGRVQGVAYRMSAQRVATRLGLTGWVRNQDDGSVALEAQGEAERVAELLGWCAHGPPGARVSRVEHETVPTVAESRFEIRH
jgi:acylphosphatase